MIFKSGGTERFFLLQKTMALLLSLSLILCDPISYAASLSPEADPGKGMPADLATLLPSDLIPATFGKVDESFAGDSNKSIIYIQDAHDSLDAQENIARIIAYLVEHHGVRTVYEEGYEGPVPTDKYFGFLKDPKSKERASYFLMDRLRLSGAEYAHINRTKDFNLIGADSLKNHLANITQYRKSSQWQRETARDLEAIQKEIASLINQYFPKDMKEWIKIKDRFDGHKLNLMDYMRRSKSFMMQRVSSRRFQVLYPHIDLILSSTENSRAEVLKRMNNLDPKGLFREMLQMEKDYAASVLRNERDMTIFQYYKILQIFKRLNAMEVPAAEFEVVKETLNQFKTGALAQFIVGNTNRSLVLSKRFERNLREAISFYEIAHSRDHAIEKQLGRFVAAPEEKIAVLVFGGFHRDRIQEILRRKQLSYQIVSPKIQVIDEKHKAYYKQLMTVGSYPYEWSSSVVYSRVAGDSLAARSQLPANLRIASRTQSSIQIWELNREQGFQMAREELKIMGDLAARYPDYANFSLAVETALKHLTVPTENAARSEARSSFRIERNGTSVLMRAEMRKADETTVAMSSEDIQSIQTEINWLMGEYARRQSQLNGNIKKGFPDLMGLLNQGQTLITRLPESLPETQGFRMDLSFRKGMLYQRAAQATEDPEKQLDFLFDAEKEYRKAYTAKSRQQEAWSIMNRNIEIQMLLAQWFKKNMSKARDAQESERKAFHHFYQAMLLLFEAQRLFGPERMSDLTNRLRKLEPVILDARLRENHAHAVKFNLVKAVYRLWFGQYNSGEFQRLVMKYQKVPGMRRVLAAIAYDEHLFGTVTELEIAERLESLSPNPDGIKVIAFRQPLADALDTVAPRIQIDLVIKVDVPDGKIFRKAGIYLVEVKSTRHGSFTAWMEDPVTVKRLPDIAVRQKEAAVYLQKKKVSIAGHLIALSGKDMADGLEYPDVYGLRVMTFRKVWSQGNRDVVAPPTMEDIIEWGREISNLLSVLGVSSVSLRPEETDISSKGTSEMLPKPKTQMMRQSDVEKKIYEAFSMLAREKSFLEISLDLDVSELIVTRDGALGQRFPTPKMERIGKNTPFGATGNLKNVKLIYIAKRPDGKIYLHFSYQTKTGENGTAIIYWTNDHYAVRGADEEDAIYTAFEALTDQTEGRKILNLEILKGLGSRKLIVQLQGHLSRWFPTPLGSEIGENLSIGAGNQLYSVQLQWIEKRKDGRLYLYFAYETEAGEKGTTLLAWTGATYEVRGNAEEDRIHAAFEDLAFVKEGKKILNLEIFMGLGSGKLVTEEGKLSQRFPNPKNDSSNKKSLGLGIPGKVKLVRLVQIEKRKDENFYLHFAYETENGEKGTAVVVWEENQYRMRGNEEKDTIYLAFEEILRGERDSKKLDLEILMGIGPKKMIDSRDGELGQGFPFPQAPELKGLRKGQAFGARGDLKSVKLDRIEKRDGGTIFLHFSYETRSGKTGSTVVFWTGENYAVKGNREQDVIYSVFDKLSKSPEARRIELGLDVSNLTDKHHGELSSSFPTPLMRLLGQSQSFGAASDLKSIVLTWIEKRNDGKMYLHFSYETLLGETGTTVVRWAESNYAVQGSEEADRIYSVFEEIGRTKGLRKTSMDLDLSRTNLIWLKTGALGTKFPTPLGQGLKQAKAIGAGWNLKSVKLTQIERRENGKIYLTLICENQEGEMRSVEIAWDGVRKEYLTADQTLDLEFDNPQMAEVVSGLASDPEMMLAYLLLDTGLDSKRAQALVTESVAGLAGVAPWVPDVSAYELVAGRAHPVANTIKTAAPSVMIEGKVEGNFRHLLIRGDRERLVDVNEDGTFRVRIMLAAGTNVRLTMTPIDIDKEIRGQDVSVEIEQSAVRRDLDEVIMHLISAKAGLLKAIQKDAYRYNYLQQKMEVALLQHFMEDESEGFRILEQKILSAPNAGVREFYEKIRDKFQKVQALSIPDFREKSEGVPQRVYFYQRYALYEVLLHQVSAMADFFNQPSADKYLRQLNPTIQRLLEKVKNSAVSVSCLNAEELLMLYRGLMEAIYPNEGERKKAIADFKVPGVILALEQGLGKTLVALLLGHMNPQGALILAPKSLTSNWESQAWRFFEEPKTRMMTGSGEEKTEALLEAPADSLRIVNLEYLRVDDPTKRLEALNRYPGQVVILDESQFVKNTDSLQTQTALRLQGAFKLFVSATPVSNPQSARPVLKALTDEKAFEASEAFKAIMLKEEGLDAIRQIHFMLSPYMVRIKKKNVFREYDTKKPLEMQHDRLPAKRWVPPRKLGLFDYTLNQSESMLELMVDWPGWSRKKIERTQTHEAVQTVDDLERRRRGEMLLAKIHALKQLGNNPRYVGINEDSPKAAKVREIVDLEAGRDLAAGQRNGKVVIYTSYKQEVKDYEAMFRQYGAVTYYGDTGEGQVDSDGYLVNGEGQRLRFKLENNQYALNRKGRPSEAESYEPGAPMTALEYNRLVFQNDPDVRVLIATYETGGLGATFTAADAAIFDDPPRDYIQLYQASDRNNRIDNKRKKIEVRYYQLTGKYPESFLASLENLFAIINHRTGAIQLVKKTELTAEMSDPEKFRKINLEKAFRKGTYDEIHGLRNLSRQGRIFSLQMDGLQGPEDLELMTKSTLRESMPLLFDASAPEKGKERVYVRRKTRGESEADYLGKILKARDLQGPIFSDTEARMIREIEDRKNLVPLLRELLAWQGMGMKGAQIMDLLQDKRSFPRILEILRYFRSENLIGKGRLTASELVTVLKRPYSKEDWGSYISFLKDGLGKSMPREIAKMVASPISQKEIEMRLNAINENPDLKVINTRQKRQVILGPLPIGDIKPLADYLRLVYDELTASIRQEDEQFFVTRWDINRFSVPILSSARSFREAKQLIETLQQEDPGLKRGTVLSIFRSGFGEKEWLEMRQFWRQPGVTELILERSVRETAEVLQNIYENRAGFKTLIERNGTLPDMTGPLSKPDKTYVQLRYWLRQIPEAGLDQVFHALLSPEDYSEVMAIVKASQERDKKSLEIFLARTSSPKYQVTEWGDETERDPGITTAWPQDDYAEAGRLLFSFNGVGSAVVERLVETHIPLLDQIEHVNYRRVMYRALLEATRRYNPYDDMLHGSGRFLSFLQSWRGLLKKDERLARQLWAENREPIYDKKKFELDKTQRGRGPHSRHGSRGNDEVVSEEDLVGFDQQQINLDRLVRLFRQRGFSTSEAAEHLRKKVNEARRQPFMFDEDPEFIAEMAQEIVAQMLLDDSQENLPSKGENVGSNGNLLDLLLVKEDLAKAGNRNHQKGSSAVIRSEMRETQPDVLAEPKFLAKKPIENLTLPAAIFLESKELAQFTPNQWSEILMLVQMHKTLDIYIDQADLHLADQIPWLQRLLRTNPERVHLGMRNRSKLSKAQILIHASSVGTDHEIQSIKRRYGLQREVFALEYDRGGAICAFLGILESLGDKVALLRQIQDYAVKGPSGRWQIAASYLASVWTEMQNSYAIAWSA